MYGETEKVKKLTAKSQFILEETVENYATRYFKCFSKVFGRLNPNSRDSSTNSLRRIRRDCVCLTFAFAPRRVRGEVLCNKSVICWAELDEKKNRDIPQRILARARSDIAKKINQRPILRSLGHQK
jgi:hypothetical protein